MSQDDPNPSEFSPSPVDRPPQPAAPRGWLRSTSITILRTAIQTLEQVVETLEGGDRSPAEVPRPLWQQFQRRWTALLLRVRLRLPESWNQTVGDRVLSGILLLVLLFPVWVTSNLFSSPPVKVAPNSPVAVQSPTVLPSVSPPAVAPSPSPVALPSEIIASPVPSPVPSPIPSPVPTPSPPVPAAEPIPSSQPLTPEERLIASIQTRVAVVTDQYATDLIQSIQPSFKQSRLIVRLKAEWYELTRSQQDDLANTLLQRAQDLNFSQLQITDSQGTQLARSPVVGTIMIILKRSNARQETV